MYRFRQLLRLAPGTHGDGRARVGEAPCDAPAHALGTAGHEHDHAVEIELDGHRGTVPRMANVDGPRTTITLDRAERRNALSLDLTGGLLAELNHRATTARSSRTDARGRRSQPGIDLAEMVAGDDPFYDELFTVCTNLMLRLHALPQPVIAKVQGVATAGGMPARGRVRPRGRWRHRHVR